eukprot:8704797-Karenia_brevis.AAC.1
MVLASKSQSLGSFTSKSQLGSRVLMWHIEHYSEQREKAKPKMHQQSINDKHNSRLCTTHFAKGATQQP